MLPLDKGIRNEKGFTLIEILIVVFILGILMSGLTSVLRFNFNTSYEGIDSQAEGESFRLFNSSIISDIQFAKDIAITNSPTRDVLSYVKTNGQSSTVYFESDGLYKQIGSKKVKIATGSKYEANNPAVYFQKNGMIRFNFYAADIDALLFLTIRPIIFDND